MVATGRYNSDNSMGSRRVRWCVVILKEPPATEGSRTRTSASLPSQFNICN
jgi:hypothetical protein